MITINIKTLSIGFECYFLSVIILRVAIYSVTLSVITLNVFTLNVVGTNKMLITLGIGLGIESLLKSNLLAR
jgi:hypothetical protein